MKKTLRNTLLTLFTVIFFIFLISCARKKADITSYRPASSENYQNDMQTFSGCCSPELEGIFFFGDSTTHGMIRYNAENNGEHGENLYRVSSSQIITPIGNTFYLGNLLSARVRVADKILRIEDAVAELSPEILIVTVGLNGLNSWDKESFSKYYTAMICKIKNSSQSTEIILQSVYPIAKNRSDEFMRLCPEKIPVINEWILEIASDLGLSYIDSYSVLADEEGYLYEFCHNGDGIHISTDGYNLILKNIIEHGVKK